ncbi:hypothetical protein PsorP6_013920 [Peronosclerospora sorghi]|uniref:Uncharacterized protein n=1 Tax=Peronosclerospora sorghi TaxID=230839 RepID=A0ACC0VHQ3_9STRA|nr:hypothetical protein PsorP6_013920 [Peronosclerospora sorghi]
MKTTYHPTIVEKEIMDASESPSTTVHYIGGQKFIMEGEKTEITPEAYTLLYIGTESAHLSGILMRYSNVDCFSHNPKTMTTQNEVKRHPRCLKQVIVLGITHLFQPVVSDLFVLLRGSLSKKPPVFG